MNNFLNIKIAFSLIVILLSLLGIFAIDRIDKISNQTQEIYKHPFKVTKSAITIDKYLISMHRYMKDVVLSQNDKQLKEAIEYVNSYEIMILKEYRTLFKRYLGPSKDIEDSYNAFINWRPIRDEVISLVVKNKKLLAADITKGKGALHVKLLNEKVKTLTNFASNKADEYYYNTLKYERYSKQILIIFLIMLILVSIFISIYTIRNLKESTILKDMYLKEVEKLSITDPLTNIYNKRYFDEIFEQELRRVSRSKRKLIFIIFDIDNFKKYNDNYGHLKGDEALIKVTQIIKEQLRRPDDNLFRVGGEEFAILLKTKNIKDVNRFSDNLIQTVMNLNIKHIDNEEFGCVTISMGVGIISNNSNLSSNEIYDKVDALMYKAKKNGRNNMVIKEIE